MNTASLRKISIIHLETIESIWTHLDFSSNIQYFWLGRQPYRPICELQKALHARRVAGTIGDVVLFLEHDHVYTLGKNANSDEFPIGIA